jgi:sugar phosphate isomerase/epimerase
VTRIGLQLYTVRRECADDFAQALATTASLGFEGVELHDLHGHAPEAVRELLDAQGLVACGRHALLDAIEGDLEALARELRVLGTDRLVVAWIPAPTSAAEAGVALDRILLAAERAASLGLRLGFHNHDGELRTLDDGRSLLDRLLEAGDSTFLELDLGWAWYAGTDPATLLDRARGRAPLVHVKDLRRNGGPVHAPLGDGHVPYGGLRVAAERAGVEWLLVEQDETDGPAFEAVARSLERLRALLEEGS